MLISLESLRTLLKKDDRKKKRKSSSTSSNNKVTAINELLFKSVMDDETRNMRSLSSIPNLNQQHHHHHKTINHNTTLIFNQSTTGVIVKHRHLNKHQQTNPLSNIFLHTILHYNFLKEDAIMIEKNFPNITKLIKFSESKYRDHFNSYIDKDDSRIFDSSSSTVFLAILPIDIDEIVLTRINRLAIKRNKASSSSSSHSSSSSSSSLLIQQKIQSQHTHDADNIADNNNNDSNNNNDDEMMVVDFEKWLTGILAYFRLYLISGILLEGKGKILPNFIQKIQQLTHTSFASNPKKRSINSGDSGNSGNSYVNSNNSNSSSGLSMDDDSIAMMNSLSTPLESTRASMSADNSSSSSSARNMANAILERSNSQPLPLSQSLFLTASSSQSPFLHDDSHHKRSRHHTHNSLNDSHTSINFEGYNNSSGGDLENSNTNTSSGYLPPLRQININHKLSKEKRKELAMKKYYKDGHNHNHNKKLSNTMTNTTTMNRNVMDNNNNTNNSTSSSSSNQRDMNDVRNTVLMLRAELNNTNQGLAQLDYLVDENITWVHSNVVINHNATNLNGGFSNRSKDRCRIIALERLFDVVGNHFKKIIKRSLIQWKKSIEMNKIWLLSIKYCKIKSIDLFSSIFLKMGKKQLIRGWLPWYQQIKEEIFLEKNQAMTRINALIRGFLTRKRILNKKQFFASIIIQSYIRRFLAQSHYQSIQKNKVFNIAAKKIQFFLKRYLQMKIAKKELKFRRQKKAIIKIQKMYRGHLGRKKYQLLLKENHQLLMDKRKKKRRYTEQMKIIEIKRKEDENKLLKKIEEKRVHEQEILKKNEEKLILEKIKQNKLAAVARAKKKGIEDSSETPRTNTADGDSTHSRIQTLQNLNKSKPTTATIMSIDNTPRMNKSRELSTVSSNTISAATPRTQQKYKDVIADLAMRSKERKNAALLRKSNNDKLEFSSSTPRTSTLARNLQQHQQQQQKHSKQYKNEEEEEEENDRLDSNNRITVDWINSHSLGIVFRVVTENFLERVYKQVATIVSKSRFPIDIHTPLSSTRVNNANVNVNVKVNDHGHNTVSSINLNPEKKKLLNLSTTQQEREQLDKAINEKADIIVANILQEVLGKLTMTNSNMNSNEVTTNTTTPIRIADHQEIAATNIQRLSRGFLARKPNGVINKHDNIKENVIIHSNETMILKSVDENYIMDDESVDMHNSQFDDKPSVRKVQADDKPSVRKVQSDDKPSVRKVQSDDKPSVRKVQSDDKPSVRKVQSDDKPSVRKVQPDDKPSVRKVQSDDKPSVRKVQPDDKPSVRKDQSDDKPSVRKVQADDKPSVRKVQADDKPSVRKVQADDKPSVRKVQSDDKPSVRKVQADDKPSVRKIQSKESISVRKIHPVQKSSVNTIHQPVENKMTEPLANVDIDKKSYINNDVSNDINNHNAATNIQRLSRGYLSRKSKTLTQMNKASDAKNINSNPDHNKQSKSVNTSHNADKHHDAAVNIQRLSRGYLSRKSNVNDIKKINATNNKHGNQSSQDHLHHHHQHQDASGEDSVKLPGNVTDQKVEIDDHNNHNNNEHDDDGDDDKCDDKVDDNKVDDLNDIDDFNNSSSSSKLEAKEQFNNIQHSDGNDDDHDHDDDGKDEQLSNINNDDNIAQRRHQDSSFPTTTITTTTNAATTTTTDTATTSTSTTTLNYPVVTLDETTEQRGSGAAETEDDVDGFQDPMLKESHQESSAFAHNNNHIPATSDAYVEAISDENHYNTHDNDNQQNHHRKSSSGSNNADKDIFTTIDKIDETNTTDTITHDNSSNNNSNGVDSSSSDSIINNDDNNNKDDNNTNNNINNGNNKEENDKSSVETASKQLTALQMKDLEAKLLQLNTIEQNIKAKEVYMIEMARMAEEKAAAMDQALKDMEEKKRQHEAVLEAQKVELLAQKELQLQLQQQQQQLAVEAKSTTTVTTANTDSTTTTTTTTNVTSTVHEPNNNNNNNNMKSNDNILNTCSSLYNTLPNHMKSSSSSSSSSIDFIIPPDAARMIYEGDDWCQLYDHEQNAAYWYNISSQAVQWHTPGTLSYEHDELISATDAAAAAAELESGYESTGALTDYSTENYESGGDNDEDDSEYGGNGRVDENVWQEYWDEQAFAKYWYNNATGEATWTRPMTASISNTGATGGRGSVTGDGRRSSASNGSGSSSGSSNNGSNIDINKSHSTVIDGMSLLLDDSSSSSSSSSSNADMIIHQESLAHGEDSNMNMNETGAVVGGTDDWISYLDEATGQEYWYNVITGQTSWS